LRGRTGGHTPTRGLRRELLIIRVSEPVSHIAVMSKRVTSCTNRDSARFLDRGVPTTKGKTTKFGQGQSRGISGGKDNEQCSSMLVRLLCISWVARRPSEFRRKVCSEPLANRRLDLVPDGDEVQVRDDKNPPGVAGGLEVIFECRGEFGL
jgi:hypothetical protein